MSGRRWAAAVAVAVLLAVVAWMLPHRDDGAVEPRSTPAAEVVDPPRTAPPPRRRAAQPEAAPAPATVEEKPVVAAATASLIVHVLASEDRAPIAGAMVHVTDKDDVDRVATTDAAGMARIAGLALGRTRVWAESKDRLRSGYDDPTYESGLEVGREKSVEIVLDAGVLFEGIVLGARDGRPIAGAAVDVDEGGALGDDAPGLDCAPTLGLFVTDSDGRFHLRVPSDALVTPRAAARGFVARSVTFRSASTDARGAPAELRLEPGGALRGTVRDPDGRPVAGARVYSVRADWTGLVEDPEGTVVERGTNENQTALKATTDADGRFDVDGLALGGSYIAFAKAKGWARSPLKTGALVTYAAPTADVDFALRRLGKLVIRFVDADGRPATPKLSLHASAASSVDRDVGADGVFRLDEAEPTKYGIDAFIDFAPRIFTSIDVPEGASVDTTLTFERAVAIEGTVVDDRGEPVAGAQITARQPWKSDAVSTPATEVGTTHSGVDGRFVIGGLRAGAHKLSVESEVHASLYDQPIDAPATEVRLVIQRGGDARIHVVPTGPAPTTRFAVRAERLVRGRWSQRRSFDGWFGNGWFTFHGLVPGTWRLRVMSQEFATLTTSTFEVAPSDTVDLGDVTLDPGGAVVGRVEDSSGAPIAGAQVDFGEADSPEFRHTLSAADGAFHLEHVAPGAVEIRVSAQGFATTTSHLAAGADPVVVRLPHGALLHVSVVDGSGAPVAGAHVVVYAAGATEKFDFVAVGHADLRGLFDTRLAAGKYRATIWLNQAPAEVDVAEGGDAAVRLVVR